MDKTAEASRAASLNGRPIARALILLIDCYRFLLSPLLGRHCRFHPTCSSYAREAIVLHGALRGSWLALARLARCHPWAAGGIDEVPAHAARMNKQEPVTAERNH